MFFHPEKPVIYPWNQTGIQLDLDMLRENLMILPAWESYHIPGTGEGEEWKWKDSLEAGKSLYNQWREIFQLVMAFIDTLPEAEEDQEAPSTRQLILENAYIIAPKILSASGDTLYEIKMENASIIRFNCRQMMNQLGYAVLVGEADPLHKSVIDDAMEEFIVRFRHWVSFFRKDEYYDEWGLYV